MTVRSTLGRLSGGLVSNGAFVRLFAGRLVTNAGDSIYLVAALWLVHELTGSPFYTGLAAFLVQVPTVLSFLTGPLVDRWSLGRILVGTQVVNAVVVLAVPLAARLGQLPVWLVLASMPLLTLVNQFVYPAQNAALPRLVSDEELARANALLSSAFRGADAAFNAVAGVLVAVVGAVTLYLVDAATFAVAAVLFVGLSVPGDGGDRHAAESGDDTSGSDSDDDPPDGHDGRGGDVLAEYFGDLRAGFEYLRGSLVVTVLVGVVVTNVAFGAMRGVLPSFAAARGGAGLFGLLMAARAGGTLVGTAGASLLDDVPFGSFAVASQFVSGVCLLGAFAAPWTPVTVVLLFVGYVPVGAFNVLFWSGLQSAADEELLGRVSATVQSAAAVALPVGSLVGGAVASILASRVVLYGVGAGGVFIAVYFLARPGLRTLPAVADLDESALGFEAGGG